MSEGPGTDRLAAPTIRPLANPPKFMVAPFMCAVIGDGAAMVVALLISVFVGTSALVFLIPFGVHVGLIVVGLMEPQVDALVWTRMIGVGRRGGQSTAQQRRRYPGPAGYSREGREWSTWSSWWCTGRTRARGRCSSRG